MGVCGVVGSGGVSATGGIGVPIAGFTLRARTDKKMRL